MAHVPAHKILIAADSFEPGNGGIARVSRLMAKVAESMAHNYSLEASLLSYSDIRRPEGINLPFKSAQKSKTRFILEIRKKSKECGWIFYDSVHMAKAHIIIGKKYANFLVWMHGIEVWEQSRLINSVTFNQADIILCNSEYTLKKAYKYNPSLRERDIKVCWLGTESSVNTLASLEAPNVLTVGRLLKDSKKGHYEMLRVWPQIVKKVPGAKWIIIGKGNGLNAFRQKVQNAGLADSVDICGYVVEKQMHKFWENAGLFSLPSRVEGFGIVYAEAMRHGLPVIASKYDAGSEINIDNVTGFNVDPSDGHEIASKIVALLSDRQLAKQMGRNGRKIWEEKLCFDAFAKRFKKHCETIFSKN